MTSASKEEASFGFREAIADRAAILEHADLKSDYDRFCKASGTRNMKLEGVRCPESQVGTTRHRKRHPRCVSFSVSVALSLSPKSQNILLKVL